MPKNPKLLNSFRLAYFLAARQLKHGGKWTSILIILVMTLTFLNIVVINGVLVGLAEGSAEEYRTQFSGDILITPQDYARYINQSKDITNLISGTPGVTGIVTRYVQTGTLITDYKRNLGTNEKPHAIDAAIAGIDPEVEDGFTHLSHQVVDGEYLRPHEEGYVLIGSGLLKEYSDGQDPEVATLAGIHVGDKVKVRVGETEKEEIVKGVIESKIGNVNLRIYMNDEEFRQLIDRSDFNVNEIGIHISPKLSLGGLADMLRANPMFAHTKVQTSAESQGQFLKDIELGFSALGAAIGFIALLVASVTVFIVMFINALSRRKYIGILKAIGVDRFTLQTTYALQALFYAICGMSISLIIIYGVLKPILDVYPITTPLSDGVLVAPILGTLIRAIILILVTISAGYIPAKLIVRKNTLDSILGRP